MPAAREERCPMCDGLGTAVGCKTGKPMLVCRRCDGSGRATSSPVSVDRDGAVKERTKALEARAADKEGGEK